MCGSNSALERGKERKGKCKKQRLYWEECTSGRNVMKSNWASFLSARAFAIHCSLRSRTHGNKDYISLKSTRQFHTISAHSARDLTARLASRVTFFQAKKFDMSRVIYPSSGSIGFVVLHLGGNCETMMSSTGNSRRCFMGSRSRIVC